MPKRSVTKELRLAAAVAWYAQGSMSQERAAEIAGISRAEFIDALGRFAVSPFQYSAEEIIGEATRVLSVWRRNGVRTTFATNDLPYDALSESRFLLDCLRKLYVDC